MKPKQRVDAEQQADDAYEAISGAQDAVAELDAAGARALIEQTCEQNGWDFQADYSGRAMYGDTCYAVVAADPLEVVRHLPFAMPRMDNMGRGTVVYWPELESAPDKEQEDEPVCERCGEPAMPDAPLRSCITSPPLSGHPVEHMTCHVRCVPGEDMAGWPRIKSK